jgi:hypothetical protein
LLSPSWLRKPFEYPARNMPPPHPTGALASGDQGLDGGSHGFPVQVDSVAVAWE